MKKCLIGSDEEVESGEVISALDKTIKKVKTLYFKNSYLVIIVQNFRVLI